MFWKLFACAVLFIAWLVVGATVLDRQPPPPPKLVNTPHTTEAR